MTTTFTRDPAPPEALMRARIRDDLPAEVFRARPHRYLNFILLQGIFWGSVLTATIGRPAWPVSLLLGLVAGMAQVSQAFLAHEALHGALGGPRWLRLFVGWLGFGPELIPPSFWIRWHNVAHHGNTNMGDRDPDNFGTLRRYEKNPAMARFVALSPGSGTWYSYLFFLYSFTFHAQVVLLLQAKHRKEFAGQPRGRWIAQAVLCVVPWAGLAVAGGWWAVFTVLVPFMTANFIGQSYILTNHFLRGMAETNDPIANSMSVRSWRITDLLFFNFSHHVEHHLFPRMPSTGAPTVRAWLERNEAESYVCPGHWRAVAMLYRTPRVYRDAKTLCDPDGGRVTPLASVEHDLVAAKSAAS
ncbi:MAG: fatty acid desaturase [Microthrixaceae bacterium]